MKPKTLLTRGTKYIVILLAVLFSTIFLFTSSTNVYASSHTDSGSITLGGTVTGSPPTEAAVILKPVNNQKFTSSSHITVSGTCPVGTTVEVYKNNIFAGATDCESNGKFSLQIDLVEGENTLLAKVRDNLNQYGPNSKTVTVFYLPIGTTGAKQLVLLTNTYYQGQPGNGELKIKVEIVGGTAPYALTIDWGDGIQDLLSKAKAGKFTATHTYKKSGTYKISIKATDSLADSAYIQTIGVVRGQIIGSGLSGSTENDDKFAQTINVLLLLFSLILLVITTFWAGKKWEFHEIDDRYQMLKKPDNKL